MTLPPCFPVDLFISLGVFYFYKPAVGVYNEKENKICVSV